MKLMSIIFMSVFAVAALFTTSMDGINKDVLGYFVDEEMHS